MATAKKKTTARKASKSAPTTSRVAAGEKPAKTAVRKSNGRKPAPASVAAEERYRMIELAAYYAAEKDGFKGNSSDYWAKAEAEVNARLSARR
jgi:hypothetical protein